MHLLLAASGGGDHGGAVGSLDPGFLTRNVWLIPLLPAISFALTLLFGKRLRSGGTQFGLLLVGAALVLSTVLGVEWYGRGHVTLEEHSSPAIAATYRGTAAGDEAKGVAEVVEQAEQSGKPAPQPRGGHGEAGEHGATEGEGEHGLGAVGRTALPAVSDGGGAADGGETAHGHAIDVRPYHETEKTWFRIGRDVEIGFGFHVDGFAVAVLWTVCFVSFLVHLYSTEYLRDDRRKTHYFAALGLFTAGMLLMVSASTSLQLLVGWEIMGLCSFMLIGHWWEEEKNSRAALKAFFTTRTGDIGLLVGLSILFFGAGQTFNIALTNQMAASGGIPRGFLVAAAAALFVACIGKSAQFPLHTWLPDAMAGPTPASSLIHAATMVVAGVYMVGRLYPVFFEAFSISFNDWPVNPIALIGGITLLIAGLLAFVQTDIKKVLAYSTVSQLGYMVMGLGVGAWTGAIFHLFTHAFFKALLFMGAGSISHGCYHSFDMRDYGGLRKYMPKTFATFMIGTVALMGLPPLAGFWSKDEILLGAYSNGYRSTFFIVGCLGAALTCAYMTRVVYKTFWGEHHGPQTPEAVEHHAHAAHGDHDDHHAAPTVEPALAHAAHTAVQAERGPQDDEHAVAAGQGTAHGGGSHAVGHDDHGAHGDGHGNRWGVHESPSAITIPLIALAVMSCVAGIINAPFFDLQFTHFTAIESVVGVGAPEPAFDLGVAFITTLPGLVGIALAYLWWFKGVRFGLDGITQRNGAARAGYRLLENRYYLDALYERVVVRAIAHPIARAANWFNQNVLDGAVNGVGWVARRSATFTYESLDQRGVDGVVNGVGAGATGLGRGFKLLATGRVQQYAAVLLGGAAAGVLVILAITFSRS